MLVMIEVKDGNTGFRAIKVIERSIRQHVGWESIRYKGRRYQVFGGIRNPLFIDISNPLRGKS